MLAIEVIRGNTDLAWIEEIEDPVVTDMNNPLRRDIQDRANTGKESVGLLYLPEIGGCGEDMGEELLEGLDLEINELVRGI